MALITIQIDTSQRERARGAQWALAKTNEKRAQAIPPKDPLTIQEFLVDVIERQADIWADQQLREESAPSLLDKFLRASAQRRQEIIALINSPE